MCQGRKGKKNSWRLKHLKNFSFQVGEDGLIMYVLAMRQKPKKDREVEGARVEV